MKKGRPLYVTPGKYQMSSPKSVDLEQHNNFSVGISYTPINLVFKSGLDDKVIGEFLYNVQAGEWVFIGDSNESAKVFAKYLCDHFKELIWHREDELI
jgi:hypothetical protein